ncbi:MAG: FAD-dependent oxidoreductase [Flavonifractor plautii]
MYDIAVIGGGPAGLSAAIQARARNKSVLVVSGDDRDNPSTRPAASTTIWVFTM